MRISVFHKLIAGLLALFGLAHIASAGVNDINGCVHKTLWRYKVGSYNYVMSTDKAAVLNYLSTSDGQIAYIPASSEPGTRPLYRFSRTFPGGMDHMMSTATSEPEYANRTLMGYVYTSQLAGTCKLIRYANAGHYHCTMHEYETPPSGYWQEAVLGYVYLRYGLALQPLSHINYGGIDIAINRNAGGTIWNWTWNGFQFINNGNGLGKQLQMCIYYDDAYGRRHNPAEAGKTESYDFYDPNFRMGSALNGWSIQNNALYTQTTPIEWNPNNAGVLGGQDVRPVAYPGISFHKAVYINYNNMGATLYHLTVTMPQSIDTSKNPLIEIISGHFVSNLSQFYYYNAETKILTPWYYSLSGPDDSDMRVYNRESSTFMSHYGGIICTGPGGAYAFGLYGHDDEVGGSVHYWNVARVGDGSDGGQYGQHCSVLRACSRLGFNQGQNVYNVYLISDTLSGVIRRMNTLYANRASLPN